MDAKIRRYQSNLIISGSAVIAFGLWSIIKFFMFIYFDPISLEAAFEMPVETQGVDIDDGTLRAIVYGICFILLGLDFLIRFYIGFSAIKEGKGIPKRKIYIIVASIVFLINISGNIATLTHIDLSMITITLTSVIIDLTSCMALASIIVSSVQLRKNDQLRG